MGDKLKPGRWLYVLFVFTLPFAFQVNIFGAPVQLSDLLFLAAAIMWAIAFIAGREIFRWNKFYICLAAYAVAVTLSTITSFDPARSSIKLAGKFMLIGIAFLTFNVVTSVSILKRVLQAWTLGAAVVIVCSVLGIVLFYAGLRDPSQNIVVHPGYGSLPPGDYPRIHGLFLYPALLCNFLSVTWMFALASRSSAWLRAPTFWLLGIGLFTVDAFTLTPGLGGIFLATGFFFWKKFRNVFGGLAFASGLLIAAAFFFVACVQLVPYKGEQMPDTEWKPAPSARVQAWQTAFETFLQDPLLGRGVGTPVANAELIDPTGSPHLLTDAHNTYLSVLGETGSLGFLTFMSIVCFATLTLFKWKPESGSYKTIRLCLLLAILDAFFYQSLTGSYEDTRHLWVLFGLAVAVGRLISEDKKKRLGVHQA